MPYKNLDDLPDPVKNVLPPKAQRIFFEAYNSANEEYKNPEKRRGNESLEEVSMKVAWNAVKNKYQKGDDGKWQKK